MIMDAYMNNQDPAFCPDFLVRLGLLRYFSYNALFIGRGREGKRDGC